MIRLFTTPIIPVILLEPSHHYMCSNVYHTFRRFFPIVVEALGGWHKDAEAAVSKLARQEVEVNSSMHQVVEVKTLRDLSS